MVVGDAKSVPFNQPAFNWLDSKQNLEMLDALTLRSQVVQILDGQLGTYAFPCGDSDVSVAVLPDPELGAEYPPQGTKTEGIEVVISIPSPGYAPRLGRSLVKPYRWGLLLKQWNENGNLLEATETLVAGLDYLLSAPIPVPRNDLLGIVEQVKVEILEFDFQALK